jgi:hypothetical protein
MNNKIELNIFETDNPILNNWKYYALNNRDIKQKEKEWENIDETENTKNLNYGYVTSII